MRRNEWAFKWCTLTFLAAVTLALTTAQYGDGLRYDMRQFLIYLWSLI